MDVCGGDKAVCIGTACQFLWCESTQQNFELVEVEFCLRIGSAGTDNIDLETLFILLLIISVRYMYGAVENCLLVK